MVDLLSYVERRRSSNGSKSFVSSPPAHSVRDDALNLMPLVEVFTTKGLEDNITDAGFQIDYQWQPGKGKAVFIVAKKAE